MACRYVLSSQHRPDVSPAERTHKVIAIVNKMVSMMEGVIQVSASLQSRASSVTAFIIFKSIKLVFFNISDLFTCWTSS